MNLTLELASLKNQNLPIGERARLSCSLAKRREKVGDYKTARQALSEFWPDRDSLNVEGLDESSRAAVLLRVGALTGWLGESDQVEGSQERAKNLITKSL